MRVGDDASGGLMRDEIILRNRKGREEEGSY